MSSALRPLQKQLHDLLESKDYTNVARLIESNQCILSSTTDKGLVSLLLRYAIATEDDEMMVSLVPRFTAKRDFFTVIEYNQKRKGQRNVELFQRINPELIEPRDIKMMVENGLNYLLPLLDNKFVKVDIRPTIDTSPALQFKPLLNIDSYIAKLTNKIQKKKELNRFIECINAKNYDIVVDAGNVLHSRDGQFRPDDLFQLLGQLTAMGFRPLVVIFYRRARDIPDLDRKLNGVEYCITPAEENDDYFVLLAYLLNLKKGVITHNVTNDEYQDHNLFLNDGANVNSDFTGHMRDDQIKYTNTYGRIAITTPIKNYSNCLQINDRIAYIPTIYGGFIMVHL
jgi:hypothetical protein